MTARAKPDFPYVQSYWSLDQDIEVSPPLRGDHTTEVVVIGAGFAGLASALGLIEARPDLKVTVIEAHHAGYGASGRNSGQIFNLPPGSTCRPSSTTTADTSSRGSFVRR